MTDQATVEAVAPAETTEQVTVDPVAKETPAPSEGEKQTDDAGKEPAKQDKPEPTEAEKVQHAMQKRIDKMTAKLAERERQIQEIEQKYLKEKPVQSTAPKEDDFESVEDYLKALGRYEAEQEIKTKETERQNAERQAAYQKMIAERQNLAAEKEAEIKKVTPDYDEKVKVVEESISMLSDSQKGSIGFQVFRDMLFSSDNMPALTYELGKNPDLMDEMLTMNPLQIARKIARLEIQLENAPKPQTKPVAIPPNPIKGGGTPKTEDQMSGKELLKKYKLT
jgi:hypothetical protein